MFILEILGEFLMEGLVYLAFSKSVPRWIRYPILALIVVFFGSIIFGMFALTVKLLVEELYLQSLILGGIAVAMLVGILYSRDTIIKKFKVLNDKDLGEE